MSRLVAASELTGDDSHWSHPGSPTPITAAAAGLPSHPPPHPHSHSSPFRPPSSHSGHPDTGLSDAEPRVAAADSNHTTDHAVGLFSPHQHHQHHQHHHRGAPSSNQTSSQAQADWANGHHRRLSSEAGRGYADNKHSSSRPPTQPGNLHLGTYIDDVLEEAKPFGPFQRRMLLKAMLGSLSAGSHVISIILVQNTIVDELNLSSVLKAVLVAATFAGWLVGAFFWGFIIDKYGRRPGLLASLAGVTILGAALSASQDFPTLISLRVLTGAQIGGTMLCSFTLLSEYIAPSKRGIVSTLWQTAFGIGIMLMALGGYIAVQVLEASWHWVLAIACIPSLLAVAVLYFVLPESPRYLLVQKRYDDLTDCLQTVVDCNGVEMIVVLPLHDPDAAFFPDPRTVHSIEHHTYHAISPSSTVVAVKSEDAENETGNVNGRSSDSATSSPSTTHTLSRHGSNRSTQDIVVVSPSEISYKEQHSTDDQVLLPHHGHGPAKGPVLSDLVAPALRRSTLVLGFVWFTNSLVYYGLTFLAADLSSNVFFNTFLSGLVEIPGYLVAVLLVDRIGRKKSLNLFMLIAGCATATMIAPLETLEILWWRASASSASVQHSL
ncbi:hypothetical protein CAOG_008371 [Capsaspora owczarzaki ATCC 30864]|uniref:Major facilitator superfamily (MFS) profile domain-containing protein n=2 Tax=Capsaspora owczarzaki (strain ATCC 30864) TaxID=595528 RepID=A0A0D2UTW2_CAPO3|nr:hypothetical protein CAOG_008371 [Capsaspora owczarzaki ATCC 30864]